MQKWEYRIIRVHRVSWEEEESREILGHHERTTSVFNQMGEQGWELVGVGYDAIGGIVSAVFKRPKEGE